jgi:hydrogenase maturation protease
MTAVVIGYGNTLRSDDGAGPAVADAVAALRLPGVRVVAVHQLTPDLAELLADARPAVFVDAAIESPYGYVEVRRVQPAQQNGSLGHTSDPGVLVALASAVYGVCPPTWIVRVPVASFQLGTGLSRCASDGVAEAVREVLHILARSEVMPVPACAQAGSPRAGACL